MSKRKRGTLIYCVCLAIYIIILCALAAYGLRIVWRYAIEYENSRPANVINAYVNELNENLWDESIAQTIANMPHEAQTDEECAECVKEMLKDGITYVRKSGGGDGSRIVYSLKCSNGNEFGTVTMVEDQSKADEIEFGMLPWKIESEEFNFDGLYTTVETVVPRMYSVFVNGYLLGDEYIVEDGIHYDVLDGYYDMFQDLPTKVRYRFEHAMGILEPVVRTADGAEVTIDETQDDSQFITPCSEAQLERLSSFAAGFADRYLRFSSGVSDPMYAYEQLMGYIVVGSDFDNYLHSAMDGLSYGHTSSYRMDSTVLNGALDLGDGYYMCDITAMTTITYPGKGEVQNTNNMRVIAVDRDGDIRAVTHELY